MTDFVHQLHAAYHTPPDVLAAIVGRVTQRQVVGLEKVVRGYESEVYQVTIQDGERLVIRIRRYGPLRMEDEAWAIAQARAAGAPVPDVLLCECHWIDGAERDVMVQRAVPGHPLAAQHGSLGEDQLRSCFVQAGAALATIHRVPVEGFYMRRQGVWDFASWEDVATANLRDRTAERATVRTAGVTDAELDTLLGVLDRLQRALPWPNPVLIHGDYTPAHLFFDTSPTLTGIIDFGQAQGGAPIIDLHDLLASTEAWGVPEDRRLAWIRDGYGTAPIWEHFAERRLMHAIGFTLGSLSYHCGIGDRVSVVAYAHRLRALIDQCRLRSV
jgi:aminoglycoside phosphotransferase (APT) family kinase protein